MFSILYILFILVMTHALDALPFSGPGYYGGKFHKVVIKESTNKKVYKPMYSLMDPMLFHKKMITKVPIKGFRKGYPLFTPSLIGKLPFNNMQPGKPIFDSSSFNNQPFSYLKTSFIPLQSVPKHSVVNFKDFKNSKRIPNIYELSFDNLKPNIPFVDKINMPFDVQTESTNQPLPNIDNAKVITIDIVKGNDLPQGKLVIPLKGEIGVFNEPQIDMTNTRDAPNGGSVDLTIVEFGDSGGNEKPFVDNPILDNNVKDTNLNNIDVNTLQDVSSFDSIVKIPDVINTNDDIIINPIIKEVGASADKVVPGTVATIGDIPGFIVDGGMSLETGTEPIYDITNEVRRHEQEIGVLNANDVVIAKPGAFDLNPKDLLPNINGDNLAISGDFNVNGILDVGIQSGVDTGSFVMTASPGGNTDLNILDNNAEQSLNPLSVGTNDFSLSNDVSMSIKPDGKIVDNAVNISGGSVTTTKEDVNNHGIGSVVVIRPVSFQMKVEPFGPGPYGQCREPSRVICGARFGWEHVTGMVEWCKLNCIVYMYSSYCDDDRCQCKCM